MDNLAQTNSFSGITKRYMDFKVPSKINHIKAKKPQKSKTLMRPALHQKANIVSNTPILKVNSISYQPDNDVNNFNSPKFPAETYDEKRYKNIRKIPRSELINRFKSTRNLIQDNNYNSLTSNENLNNSGIKNKTFIPNFQIPNNKEMSRSHKMLGEIASIGEEKFGPSNIFEKAVYTSPIPEQFESNKKYKNKTKKNFIKKHPISSTAGLIVAVLLIGGVYLFQNLNQISYYLASSRAGFTPTISNYKPSGYNLASISSASGVIETNYRSNTSNNNYSLIEKKSNISSYNLLTNFVFNQVGLNYQTMKVKNYSVYILNNNSEVTWVNGGIWYLIKNNGSLSNHQVYKIANSI